MAAQQVLNVGEAQDLLFEEGFAEGEDPEDPSDASDIDSEAYESGEADHPNLLPFTPF